jgi:hypothetical protein
VFADDNDVCVIYDLVTATPAGTPRRPSGTAPGLCAALPAGTRAARLPHPGRRAGLRRRRARPHRSAAGTGHDRAGRRRHHIGAGCLAPRKSSTAPRRAVPTRNPPATRPGRHDALRASSTRAGGRRRASCSRYSNDIDVFACPVVAARGKWNSGDTGGDKVVIEPLALIRKPGPRGHLMHHPAAAKILGSRQVYSLRTSVDCCLVSSGRGGRPCAGSVFPEQESSH